MLAKTDVPTPELPMEWRTEFEKIDGIRQGELLLRQFPDMPIDEIYMFVSTFGDVSQIMLFKQEIRTLKEMKVDRISYEDYAVKVENLSRLLSDIATKAYAGALGEHQKSQKIIDRWKQVVVGRERVLEFQKNYDGMRVELMTTIVFMGGVIDLFKWRLDRLEEIFENLDTENRKYEEEIATLKGQNTALGAVNEEMRALRGDVERMKIMFEERQEQSAKDISETTTISDTSEKVLRDSASRADDIPVEYKDETATAQIVKPLGVTKEVTIPPKSPKRKADTTEEIPEAQIQGHENGYYRFFCDVCNDEFSYNERALDPLLRAGGGKISCDRCNKVFLLLPPPDIEDEVADDEEGVE